MAHDGALEAMLYVGTFGSFFTMVWVLKQRAHLFAEGSLMHQLLMGTPCVGKGATIDGKQPVKAVTGGMNDLRKLAFYGGGIQVTYLAWGLLQERIMTGNYDGERFTSSKFLVLCNRVLALALAVTLVRRQGNMGQATPLYKYSYCSMSNILSSVCQYEALKYVSFPTQVLVKSCKILPVMLMGIVLSRKSYSLWKYVMAVLITGGVFLFKMSEQTSQKASGQVTNNAVGIPILTGYMLFDSFTSTWQSQLFTEYRMSSMQMMCYVNAFSSLFTTFSLLVANQLVACLLFTLQHPQCLLHIVLMSCCSALGQLFIFWTIKDFGAFTFAVIQTIRQLLSIMLSMAIFGHSVQWMGWLGIALVFSALFQDLIISWRTTKVNPKEAASPTTPRDK